MSRTLLLALLLLAGSAGAASVNPIDQVVSMIEDLATKLAADAKAEEAAFKKFFEWCDDAAADAKFTVKTETMRKEDLDALIAKSVADITAAETSIEELAASISAAEADLKAAGDIREKEAADFAATEAELVEGINELDSAITTIMKETTANPALLQKRVDSHNVQAVLATLETMLGASAFSLHDRQKLTALVQHQSEQDPESELGAPSAEAYTEHTGGITDILEDMKEKAEGELSDARTAEESAKHNFKMLTQSLKDQLMADNHDLDATKTAKASAEETKATAEGDLSVCVADLKNAEANLENIRTECMTSATDHENSKKSRAEEAEALATAKKVVVEATGGAVSQTYSFIQSDSVSSTRVRSHVQSSADLANLEIVTIVKKLAKEQHSKSLAQLASRISAAMRFGAANGDDVYAKIKGLISDMIAKLQKEASGEASQKQYCDDETKKTTEKKEDLSASIDSLTAKLDKAIATSNKDKEEIAELQKELAALAKSQVEMDSIRMDEGAAFAKSKADLESGIAGVQKALEVLREYYGSSFVQQPAMPAGHSASSDAGGAIISMLEQCESDFTQTLSKESLEEDDAKSSYEETSQKNKVTKAQKEQDAKYLTAEAKGLDKAISEHSSDKAGLQTELGAVLEYNSKLSSMCVAKPESYEERKARREAEISGLKDALKILEGEGMFVQKHLRHVGRH